MQPKSNIVCAIFFGVSLVNVVSIAGVPRERPDPNRQEFLQDHARLDTLWQVDDVNAVKNVAKEIQRKWIRRDKEYYGMLMLQVCTSLRSRTLAGPRTSALAREYALIVLSDPNELPLETELDLVGQVMSDMSTRYAPKGQEWMAVRKADVDVRFHAWQRLEKAIDPNWDQNEFWLLKHPRPPETVPWIVGNPPEAIKDDAIRAKYEAELKEYWDKVEYHNQQRRLRKLEKLFITDTERYIIDAYSKPPFKIDELRQYLEKYAVDPKTKARILDAVRLNMENQKKADLNIK